MHLQYVGWMRRLSQPGNASVAGQTETRTFRHLGKKIPSVFSAPASGVRSTQVIHLFVSLGSREMDHCHAGKESGQQVELLIRQGGLCWGTLSVNIPQVWERQRKGAGEEEGSRWIPALYGHSNAFPRVCGSDFRRHARCCTSGSPVPPRGAANAKLQSS